MSVEKIVKPEEQHLPFFIRCGTLSTTTAGQTFSTGYSSNEYMPFAFRIGSNTYLQSAYVKEVNLQGNGNCYIERTSAGAYGGATFDIGLIKL